MKTALRFPEGGETVEKVAKPLFRVGLHKIFTSISSSQAADHSHPCKPECSFPPLLLLSQKTIKWFSGDPIIVGKNFVKSVISEAQKVNWPKAKRSHPGVCPRK